MSSGFAPANLSPHREISTSFVSSAPPLSSAVKGSKLNFSSSGLCSSSDSHLKMPRNLRNIPFFSTFSSIGSSSSSPLEFASLSSFNPERCFSSIYSNDEALFLLTSSSLTRSSFFFSCGIYPQTHRILPFFGCNPFSSTSLMLWLPSSSMLSYCLRWCSISSEVLFCKSWKLRLISVWSSSSLGLLISSALQLSSSIRRGENLRFLFSSPSSWVGETIGLVSKSYSPVKSSWKKINTLVLPPFPEQRTLLQHFPTSSLGLILNRLRLPLL